MAIAVTDTAIASPASTTGVSITTSGSDRVLYVAVSEDVAADQNFTMDFSAFGGSSTAAPVGESTGTGQYICFFRLANPTATTGTVISSGGTGSSIIAAIALSGVDQGTPDDYVDAATNIQETSTGNTHTGKTITSAAGDLVVSFLSVNGNVPVANAAPTGTSQTQHEVLDDAGAHTADISSQPGGASVTPSWGTFGGNRRASSIAFNVNVAAAAASASNMMLLGVGA